MADLPRRHREGRDPVADVDDHSGPDCYPTQPHDDDGADDKEPEAPDDDGDGDDQGEARSGRGNPTSKEESSRRAAPADRRCELMKLHKELNHPSNGNLQRLLRHSGATREAVRDAGSLRCAACGDAVRTKQPRVTKVPADFVFNTKVVGVEVPSRHVSRRGEGDSVFEGHRPQFLALVGDVGWGAGQRRS